MSHEEHDEPKSKGELHYAAAAHPNEVTLFARTNFRNQLRPFGIKTDDRRRHMYLIGKSGTGKTTLLENLIYQDIVNGHGLALVDPHGDFAEKIIGLVPNDRTADVIYVNPADIEFPVGFNVMEWVKEEQKFLIAAGLMGVFKKIWPDVWSARMEHIMNNCILALLDYPNSTLLGINRILTDRDYRRAVVAKVSDPVIRSFWLHEFERWEPKFQKEAIAPIQNKVGQFLSSTLIRNIVAQTKSTFDVRAIMDTGKILIINLSKGRIGEDASRLLGGMLITKIQLAAMERVDLPEETRKDFYLYVDEFQNFATESFANILSEARKYRLNLIIAHQYIEQLDEYVQPAVFGNVGTIVCFRVGAQDAEFLEPEFMPDFLQEDLVNIPNAQIYIKLMIDGVTSKAFSANTLPPLAKANLENIQRVVDSSRRQYAKQRAEVEVAIKNWTESMVDATKLAPFARAEGAPLRETPAVPTIKEIMKAAPKITETEVVVKTPAEAEVSLSSMLGRPALRPVPSPVLTPAPSTRPREPERKPAPRPTPTAPPAASMAPRKPPSQPPRDSGPKPRLQKSAPVPRRETPAPPQPKPAAKPKNEITLPRF